MMKKMNEKEAWLYLAGLWDNAIKNDEGEYCVCFSHDFKERGICNCVVSFNYVDIFRIGIIKKMHLKLELYLPKKHPDGYCWKYTKASANARARFCRKMSGLCG